MQKQGACLLNCKKIPLIVFVLELSIVDTRVDFKVKNVLQFKIKEIKFYT